ncbi:AraC family transcriptional regulator [Sulfitobacter sp. D35]|uniref:AraC family transcriptional regulator n=1 Tax=Sulfitobacter sp. D35 TaxID=3083252 RepID=UPI00296F03C8|nr:AraC family transcriptional regulator [Sulfitobacter sp. D35]MDW4497867.1 AraC family transcriptional regulator [Sulfitobacter sp. D35]
MAQDGEIMSGQLITRQAMVDAMSTQYNAELHEILGANWRRVNTSVLSQTDNEIHGDFIDFHLIELCMGGSHFLRMESDLEAGSHFSTKLLPTAMGYVQPHAPVQQTVEGKAKLQQIYIDDVIFRDVATALAKGDPDNLKSLGFQGVFDPQLKRLADLIMDEARKGAPGGELYADLLAQQIALIILRRRLGDDEKKVRISPLSDAEVARVMEFLEENLEETGGLETLARLIDMDVFSFTRAFKAKTGEAPHQYVIQRRLMKVKELLQHTDDRLVDITYATGFSNQAHMTTTFSKHFGIPPGAWRRMVRS